MTIGDQVPAEIDPRIKALMGKMATPARFGVTASYGRWMAAAHLVYVLDRLVEIIYSERPNKERRFIYVHLPVRHGKTEAISRILPAWYLGLNPTKMVMNLTYGDDDAKQHGRIARNYLQEFGPELFGVKVARDSSAADEWHIEKFGGMMLSSGWDGRITGKGMDLGIIDDPFKNPEDASKAKLQALWDRWTGTIRSRIMPGGTCIIIHSRHAEDDLAGRMMEAAEKGGQEIEVISFPALAECPDDEDPNVWRDVLGRKEGDALWEDFWPRTLLEDIRRDSLASDGGLNWESQYQGSPIIRSGGLFDEEKWQKIPAMPPDISVVETVRAWDLAASAGKGDWTVGAKLARLANGKTVVMDVIRRRLHPGDVETLVVSTAQMDGRDVKIRMERERNGAGKTVTARFATLLTGYDFSDEIATGDKDTRARNFAASQYGNNIYLIQADWNAEYIKEMTAGTKGKHDDQIDASSLAFNSMNLAGPSAITPVELATRSLDRVTPEMMAMLMGGVDGSQPLFDDRLFAAR